MTLTIKSNRAGFVAFAGETLGTATRVYYCPRKEYPRKQYTITRRNK